MLRLFLYYNEPRIEFMHIPILNLKKQHELIGSAIEGAVLNTLRSGNYILGQNVETFEEKLAKATDCKYAIGVANGTDALVIALRALDIGPGCEVITPSFTFAATAEAINLVGAVPVFIDIDLNTFNLDPNLIEALVTPKTKAIIPVHLYGKPCAIDRIMEIAKRHKLHVIEDNAQALGARLNGQATGSFGDIGCLSFYPTKNLGACGDAGALTTNNLELAKRIKKLRAHGMEKRYYHDEVGYNSRLDEIQAAILNVKLDYLPQWLTKRQILARHYQTRLKDLSSHLIVPNEDFDNTSQSVHVLHQYTIRLKKPKSQTNLRDHVANQLSQNGIGSMIYYPIPLHEQKAFSYLNSVSSNFPNSNIAACEVLSLPIYPELEITDIDNVSDCLKQILTRDLSLV